MEEVLFGGQMEAGMKEISKTEFKAVWAYYIEKAETSNIKESGTTACSMAKVPNISTTAKDMKATSSKTNSTEMAYSTKTIP